MKKVKNGKVSDGKVRGSKVGRGEKEGLKVRPMNWRAVKCGYLVDGLGEKT